MNNIPLLPPEIFFAPFASFGYVDVFDGFDRSKLPMYDQYGYQQLTSGGKIGIHCWQKKERVNADIPDLSVSVIWHESDSEAQAYINAYTKDTASIPFESVDNLTLSGSSECIAKFTRANNNEGILGLLARYRNYVYNITAWVTPNGYFSSIEAFAPYILAFDAHVSKVFKENA